MLDHKKTVKLVAKTLLLAAGAVLVVAATRFMVGAVELGLVVKTSTPATEQNPHTATIYAGQNVAVGRVCMWEDADNLYIKYATDITDNGQWRLAECHAHVAMDLSGIPQHNAGNPKSGGFAYKAEGLSTVEYTFTIPIGNWKSETRIAVAAHCVVATEDETGGTRTEPGWAGPEPSPSKGRATWFWYTLNEPTFGEWWQEAAWAGNATNWKTWKFPGRNRALYLEYEVGNDLEGALYAGNSRNCAAVAGKVAVTDDVVDGVGCIYVTYATDSDWHLYETHMTVEGALLDIPNTGGRSKNPVPGQFEYSGTYGPREDEVSFAVPYDSEWGSKLYIGAHAIVVSPGSELLYAQR